MRIIAGTLGGRSLRSLPGGGTRPAMGKAREALFSILYGQGIAWEQTHVLDLFAGTGSLAFECLSRGAPTAVLVDNGQSVCRCLTANAADLGLTGRCRIICDDVLKFLHRTPGRTFQLVFIDPPYRRDHVTPALAALTDRLWLTPHAFVCAEIEREARVKVPTSLELVTERLLGQTRLEIYLKTGEEGVAENENSPVPGDI